MLAQNSDNQQQNSINKSNQLFLKKNSNNKETTTFSFTKSINDIHSEALKRKINSITQYQKPYILKLFHEILAKNSENAKILCDYIDNIAVEYY